MSEQTSFDAEPSDLPWLVFVHGMSQDSRVFADHITAFDRSHRCLAIDLPGHGSGSAVPGPFGHVEFAAHVKRVLDANGVTGATYWGTHTGATVGLYLAARHSGSIARLILEGPVIPGRNPPVVTTLIEKARSIIRDQGREAALAFWWNESCWFDTMRRDPIACRAAAHRTIVDAFSCAPWLSEDTPEPVGDIDPELRKITLPTLIYNGADDHPDFLAATNEICALIPQARSHLIPGAGGFPAWERPASVHAVVADIFATTQN